MAIYRDERSGIIGRSNGSAAGNAFIAAMNQAQADQRSQDEKDYARAHAAGAKMFHTWDGWFTLESNGYRSGSGSYGRGSKARFTVPVYLYQRWGTPAVGELIAIRDGSRILLWKVTGMPKSCFGLEKYDLEFERAL